MKTAHEPPLRAGQDDVLHALVSIIATTRRHWGLPPGATTPEPASRRSHSARGPARGQQARPEGRGPPDDPRRCG